MFLIIKPISLLLSIPLKIYKTNSPLLSNHIRLPTNSKFTFDQQCQKNEQHYKTYIPSPFQLSEDLPRHILTHI